MSKKTNKDNNGQHDEQPTVPILAQLWQLIFGDEKPEIKRPKDDDKDDKE